MRASLSLAAAAAFISSVAAAPAALEKRYGSALSPTVTAILPAGSDFSAAFPSGKVYPLPNGFPSPNSAQLAAMETQGLGTLPSGGPKPPTPQADDVTSLQLIAFNELFEVAYFTELIFNITNDLPGYTFTDYNAKSMILDALSAVQAQEMMHALNANGALAKFNAPVIQPCDYAFPVDNFADAIALANTFTDVVLGTLQDVIFKMGQNTGDFPFSRGIASVVGQEGEQNGFYRLLQGKIPSSLPFLTASAREFAWSALQGFVIPGTCPNSNVVNLTIFEPLNLLTPPPVAPQDQTLSFSFTPNATLSQQYNNDWSKLLLVYMNQQNQPLNTTLQNINVNNGVVTFEAQFPWEEHLMNGLTLGALVAPPANPMLSVDNVAQAAIFGPALWIVQ